MGVSTLDSPANSAADTTSVSDLLDGMELGSNLSTFRQQDVAIAALAEAYMPLRINGIADKAGFEVVHKARMDVKNRRVAVEKKRKELKAEALKYGQTVDSEAKRLTAMLEPIEAHLEAQEDAVKAEKERIKQEEEAKKRAIVEARVNALVALGETPNPLVVAALTEEAYQHALQLAAVAKAERERLAEIERVRLAAEAEARRIEAEKLAAERAELDRIRREQEAAAAKLKADQDKVAAEQRAVAEREAAQRREVEIQQARAEAAEKSRIETENRLVAEAARKQQEAEAKAAREAKEAAEKAAREKAAEEARIAREKQEAEAAEQARLMGERERPYRDKILGLAATVESLPVPEGPASGVIFDELQRAGATIRKIANAPMADNLEDFFQ